MKQFLTKIYSKISINNTRYFIVCYAYKGNKGIGYGQINIKVTGGVKPFVEREKCSKIIIESNAGLDISDLVITNIIEITRKEYLIWIS